MYWPLSILNLVSLARFQPSWDLVFQIGGGTLQGRGSMEAVDGWAWIVPVVCDDPPKDHGWKWWQWTLLVLIVAVVRGSNSSRVHCRLHCRSDAYITNHHIIDF